MAKKKKTSYTGYFSTQFLTSLVSTTFVLMLLGTIVLFVISAKKASTYLKENVIVNVYLNENVEGKELRDLQADLDNTGYIKEQTYISKEEAQLKAKELLGTDDPHPAHPGSVVHFHLVRAHQQHRETHHLRSAFPHQYHETRWSIMGIHTPTVPQAVLRDGNRFIGFGLHSAVLHCQGALQLCGRHQRNHRYADPGDRGSFGHHFRTPHHIPLHLHLTQQIPQDVEQRPLPYLNDSYQLLL